MFQNTTGANNLAAGYEALTANTTGSRNVALGTKALYYNTDRSDLVAVGNEALYNNGLGATHSYEAVYNTAVGSKALYSNTTGYRNTANGYEALYSNNGNNNVAVGDSSLHENISGNNNVAIGALAGVNNEGDGNVFIGHNAGYYETGSNKLYIDNSFTTNPLIYGDFSQDKLKINGTIKVTEKLTAPDSGDNADMKAYAYGLVYYNGSIDTGRSSAGFSVNRTGTGTYEVTLTNAGNDPYIVSATAEIGGGAVPVTATTDYSSTANKFIIRIYRLSTAALIDNSFHFIVFKK
jgi:hypothetical protein